MQLFNSPQARAHTGSGVSNHSQANIQYNHMTATVALIFIACQLARKLNKKYRAHSISCVNLTLGHIQI